MLQNQQITQHANDLLAAGADTDDFFEKLGPPSKTFLNPHSVVWSYNSCGGFAVLVTSELETGKVTDIHLILP